MKTSIKDRIAMFFGLITYKTYISDCKKAVQNRAL